MNYESMSDFEINKAAFLLAIKLGLAECEDLMQKKNHNKDSVMYADGANWHEWDGCNNPSDAWPVITNSKISIEYSVAESGWLAHCTNFIVAKLVSGIGYEFEVTHKKPLRAAMIVFLMMNEK